MDPGKLHLLSSVRITNHNTDRYHCHLSIADMRLRNQGETRSLSTIFCIPGYSALHPLKRI